MSRITRMAFLSDLHYPFIDKPAEALARRIVEAADVDLLYFGGDIFDAHELSRFRSDPNDRLGLRESLKVTRRALKKWRELVPNAKCKYRIGNHEVRLRNYLIDKAPELMYLDDLNIKSLLRLKDYEIDLVENGERERYGKLNILHGHEASGGSVFPAKLFYDKIRGNCLIGHFHRFTKWEPVLYSGEVHGVYTNGHMQDLSQVDYVHHPQWHTGLTIVNFSRSGFFDVQQVRFLKERNQYYCWFDGKFYQ